MLSENLPEALQVVVLEGNRQGLHRLWHTGVPRSRADVPVLPPVVPTARDEVPTGERAGHTDGARRRIRAVFAKAHHLGAWDDVCQEFRHVNLKRMRQ